MKLITTPLPDTGTAADAINSVFSDHFHRFIYDFDTIRNELEAAEIELLRTRAGRAWSNVRPHQELD